jgi:hypothetical protein
MGPLERPLSLIIGYISTLSRRPAPGLPRAGWQDFCVRRHDARRRSLIRPRLLQNHAEQFRDAYPIFGSCDSRACENGVGPFCPQRYQNRFQ